MSTHWDAFCEGIADLPVDDLTLEDVARRLTTRELRHWRDAQRLGPHQVIGDALEELKKMDAALLVECVMSDGDSTVPTRVLRDAFRLCAVKEAFYLAGKIRERLEADAAPGRHVPEHGDAVADDRRVLAAEHNAVKS
jgi:hypothetical protein